MAQKYIKTTYPDGSTVISNLRRKKGIPVLSPNGTYTATRVTTWWDGSAMNAAKADGLIYLQEKTTGDYYKVDLPNRGQGFLEKDTMAQMRALTPVEILLLQDGYYKGVRLNGYYTKNDTPASIEYYISTTLDADDGGSVIEVEGIKLEHIFKEVVDLAYFGSTMNSLAYAVNKYDKIALSKDINVTATINITKSNVSIKGVGKVMPKLNVVSSIKELIKAFADNFEITNVDLQGNNLSEWGVYHSGENPQIYKNNINGFFGATSAGVGIRLTNRHMFLYGGIISNNIITNISSVTTGNTGEGLGSSRAIWIDGTTNDSLQTPTLIRNNYIKDITGREGDAIQVISFNPTSYNYAIPCVISGNVILDFNKRGIKIQASGVDVENNLVKTTLNTIEAPNLEVCVSLIESSNCKIRYNTIYSENVPNGIREGGNITTMLSYNNEISNNIIYGTNKGASFYAIEVYGGRELKVFQNIIYGGGGLTANSLIGGDIFNNIFYGSGLVETDRNKGIFLNLRCKNVNIENNRGSDSVNYATSFITVQGIGGRIQGNTADYPSTESYNCVSTSGSTSGYIIGGNVGNSTINRSVVVLGQNINLENSSIKGGLSGSGKTIYSASIPTVGSFSTGDFCHKITLTGTTPDNSGILGWKCIRRSDSDGTNSQWVEVLSVQKNATTTVKGLVNQSAKVDNATSADTVVDIASTATDVTGVVTDLNDLISKYNAMSTLVNELKAKLNAKLGADRTSGQQSTV